MRVQHSHAEQEERFSSCTWCRMRMLARMDVVRARICVYVRMCVCVCMYVCMYMCVCVYVCVYEYVYVCMCVY